MLSCFHCMKKKKKTAIKDVLTNKSLSISLMHCLVIKKVNNMKIIFLTLHCIQTAVREALGKEADLEKSSLFELEVGPSAPSQSSA